MGRSKRKNTNKLSLPDFIYINLFKEIEHDNIEQFKSTIATHFTAKNGIYDLKIESIRNHNNESLMFQAVYFDSLYIFQELIENIGINPTVIDPLIGQTPIHYAAKYNAHKCMKYLLDYFRDEIVDVKDIGGYTSLHLIVMHKEAEEIIKTLIDCGADVDARDGQLHTPLHIAILEGIQENVKILLELGADPMAIDQLRYTPLHYAVELGDPQIVYQLLMTNKVDVSIENCAKLTPIDIVRYNKNLYKNQEYEIIESFILGYTSENNTSDSAQCQSTYLSANDETTSLIDITGRSDLYIDPEVGEFEII